MDLHQVSISATVFPVVAGSFVLVDTQSIYQEKATLDWHYDSVEGDPNDPNSRSGYFIPWPMGLVTWRMTWAQVGSNLVAILMTTDDRERALQWVADGVGNTGEDLVVYLDRPGLAGSTAGVFSPKRYISARVAKDGGASSLTLTLTSQGNVERGPSSIALAALGQPLSLVSLL